VAAGPLPGKTRLSADAEIHYERTLLASRNRSTTPKSISTVEMHVGRRLSPCTNKHSRKFRGRVERLMRPTECSIRKRSEMQDHIERGVLIFIAARFFYRVEAGPGVSSNKLPIVTEGRKAGLLLILRTGLVCFYHKAARFAPPLPRNDLLPCYGHQQVA
jgi:hypothetical protein